MTATAAFPLTVHRLEVSEPGVIVSITRHSGTQLRDVGEPSSGRSDTWSREVFPHSELTPLAENLWVVRGEFPSSPLPRNMVVYRYGGDSLLLHSVVALDEPSMRKLESLGKPSLMESRTGIIGHMSLPSRIAIPT